MQVILLVSSTQLFASMSDYSKEWLYLQGYPYEGDFCVEEEFELLGIDEYIPMICEGFGFTEIHNVQGMCYVRMGEELMPFLLVIEHEKQKKSPS